MLRTLLLVCLLLAAPSCFTAYRSSGAPVPFGPAIESSLRPGETSRAEVLRIFGSPTDMRASREGDMFRYLFTRQKEDGLDIGFSAMWGLFSLSFFRAEAERRDTENLTIFFGRDGLLDHWSYTPASSHDE